MYFTKIAFQIHYFVKYFELSGKAIKIYEFYVESGGTSTVRPSTYLYGTFTKNFGATIDNTWRIDVGVRHNF